MAIKFEKISAGMTLYDRHFRRMGNTTLKDLGEWRVKVISVDPEKRTAMVSWNSNSEQLYRERSLTRLFTWSMHSKDAEITTGLMGRVSRVRKLTKKEITLRDAPPVMIR